MRALAIALFVASQLASVYFYGRSLKHLKPTADGITTTALGTLASDERFTPIGRRYRLMSVVVSLLGMCVAALVFLTSGR